jgi:hypothetical protein
VSDLAALARRFAGAQEFVSSPLYRVLCGTVATDDHLLRLAARRRRGQQPTFLLLGAVHRLLLGGADHELARYYPSIAGPAALPPAGAGPAFQAFCREHEDEIGALVETRLVQTNVVARSVALRIGLAAIRWTTDAPVHLVEVGASAGVHLRGDRYAYDIGGHHFGDPRSPVRISTERRGAAPLPDLDATPALASVTGVDLHPLDATDAEDRAWLEALVWPENRHELDLLRAALGVVAADPPRILAGDALDVCPTLGAELPAGEPRVAFHVATRMHVPAARRPDFDAAVAALGAGGPLFTVAMDDEPFLDLRDPAGARTRLARVGGHLEWVDPLPR